MGRKKFGQREGAQGHRNGSQLATPSAKLAEVRTSSLLCNDYLFDHQKQSYLPASMFIV